jgi:hypothetical protein
MTASRSPKTDPKKRRKIPGFIVPSPIRKLAPRTERTTRSVYVVARPITKAGKLSFLSEGSLPLCHWGLLVSPYTLSALRRHLKRQSNGNCNESGNGSWGTLFEISQTENGFHQLETNNDFRPSDWDYMCIVKVGGTTLLDHRISRQGIPFLLFISDASVRNN